MQFIVVIITDEVRDFGYKEQLGISIRQIDKEKEMKEIFTRVIHLHKCNTDTISFLIQDILLRCSLSNAMYRGQVYDGAPAMAEHINCVAAQL